MGLEDIPMKREEERQREKNNNFKDFKLLNMCMYCIYKIAILSSLPPSPSLLIFPLRLTRCDMLVLL